MDYILYSIHDKKNRADLKKWRIVNLPVVQIVDVKEDGSVEMVFQFQAGLIPPQAIGTKIKGLRKGR